MPGAARVCLWGVTHLSVGSLREKVLRALGTRRAHWVVTVKRVRQRNGQNRHDLYVTRGRGEATVHYLTKVAQRVGWRARVHRPWVLRRGEMADSQGSARPRSQSESQSHPVPTPSDRWRVATWNVNGIRGKREAIRHMVAEQKVELMCLQETLRPEQWWRLSLGPGWQCLESPYKVGKPGHRGVALAVAPSVTAVDVGIKDPCCVFARVVRKGMVAEAIVGSVYVPWKGRREALSRLKDHLVSLQHRFSALPILVLGDWNMRADRVARLLAQWGVELAPSGISGSRKSFWGAGRKESTWSDLDHVVVNRAARSLLTSARVLRQYVDSDHFPVQATLGLTGLRGDSGEGPSLPREAFSRKHLPGAALQLSTHNRFAVLAESFEGECSPEDCELRVTDQGACQLDAAAQAFEGEAWQAGRELGLVRESTSKKAPAFRLPKDAKRAVRARQKAWAQWQAAQGGIDEVNGLREEYERCRVKARKAVKAARAFSWIRHVEAGAGEFLQEGGGARFWQWAKRLYAPGPQASATVPVKGDDGTLLLEPHQILQAWADHYGRLAADVTGHSRDQGYWEERAREWGLGQEAPLGPDLDADITLEELVEALRCRIKAGTAPGADGLVPELFKACLHGVQDEQASGPPNPMASALLSLIRRVFQLGHIPRSWQSATVVSIPKKGDLTVRDNYRGISLINLALKLITAIVTQRVSKALEARAWLRPEQAGFRNLEECMGQVVSLYEIARRRLQAGKRTYVCFVDLRKAFDTVPHEALLLKMRLAGVTGRCLAFFVALYRSSRIRVRQPCGLSPEVELLRGVRQGCPSSPLLFDLFINDALDGMQGVWVPGVDGRRCPGLMFADDLAILAEDAQSLAASLRSLTCWLDRWEMLAAPPKCGVMCLGAESQEVLRALAVEGMFQLQGESLPVVDTYTYLGVEIHYSLELETALQSRRSAALKCLFSLRSFLSTQSIPLHLRLSVFRGVVLPRMLYGGELVGMHTARAQVLQQVANMGTNWLMGSRGSSKLFAWRVLWAELGLEPVEDRLAAMRARGWVKFPHVRTWAGILRQNPAPARLRWRKGQAWMAITHSWLKRRSPDLTADAAQQGQGGSALADAEVRHLSIAATRGEASALQVHLKERRGRLLGSSQSGLAYVRSGFAKTQRFLYLAVRFPVLGHGFHGLAALRCGRVLWKRRLAAAGLLRPGVDPRTCPLCGGGEDSAAHLLLRCGQLEGARWKSGIQRDIGVCETILDRALEQGVVTGPLGNGDRADAMVTLLLGGRACCQEAVRYHSWLGTQRGHRVVGTTEGQSDNEGMCDSGPLPRLGEFATGWPGRMLPPFARVAAFLRVALSSRRILLKRQLLAMNRRPGG